MNVLCDRPARLLIIEDEPTLGEHLNNHLSLSGYDVTLTSAAEQGLEQLCSASFDLVLMDVLLPGQNGLEALATLRRRCKVPVILMSTQGSEQDRIAGFSRGADDYLAKPFSLNELKVRIEAVLRRVCFERQVSAEPQTALGLEFDDGREAVAHHGHWVEFTGTEYRLLKTLARHAEEVLTKAFLYPQVLHRPYSSHDRVLDMHVSHVRRKLQSISYRAGRVETVWGKGYMLTCVTL